MLPRNNADMSRKKNREKTVFCFKPKRSTELKTGQQIKNGFARDWCRHQLKENTGKHSTMNIFLVALLVRFGTKVNSY